MRPSTLFYNFVKVIKIISSHSFAVHEAALYKICWELIDNTKIMSSRAEQKTLTGMCVFSWI
jgi:hypothetical protein